MADLTKGSNVPEDGGYETERTEAACGEDNLIEFARLRVCRAW